MSDVSAPAGAEKDQEISRAKLVSFDDSSRVKSSTSKAPPTGYPEFAVRREGFSCYFDNPLPRSTFHDLVGKGIVIPLKGLKGFYKLNESLRRMGLREVPKLPVPLPSRTTEDILRLAFHAIDPDVFPEPSWLLAAEAIDGRDADHAALLVEKHNAAVMELPSDREKHAYLQGALDAAAMMAADAVPEAEET